MTPLLLIPGYLGTRLRHRASGRLIWGSFGALYRTTPEEMSGECETDGAVATITVIPRVWTYDVYGRFARAAGKRLTVFEYDWRASHADSARALARFLERFDKPVHAVAHSTGGYVLDYCLRYGDVPPADARPTFPTLAKFASLTYVGVPWEGTVAAVRDMTLGWRAAPFGRRFPPTMVRGFPSCAEAMPTWPGAWRMPFYHPRGSDPFDGADQARRFRALLARGSHAWPSLPTRLIVGNSVRTRNAVGLRGTRLDFDRFWGPGDGTVPIESALPRDLPSHVSVLHTRGRHRHLLAQRAVIADVLSRVPASAVHPGT